MTAEVIPFIKDTGEQSQKTRFQWKEGKFNNGFRYWVVNGQTGATKFMGDGSEMFCNAEQTDCLMPGTQRFYNAINGYFEGEQKEIAKTWFDEEVDE